MMNLPAVRIHRQPSGRLHAAHCLLQYSKPEPVETALERIQAGKTVFVKREDAHQLLDELEALGIEVVKSFHHLAHGSADNPTYHRNDFRVDTR